MKQRRTGEGTVHREKEDAEEKLEDAKNEIRTIKDQFRRQVRRDCIKRRWVMVLKSRMPICETRYYARILYNGNRLIHEANWVRTFQEPTTWQPPHGSHHMEALTLLKLYSIELYFMPIRSHSN